MSEKKAGFFGRLRERLSKTRGSLVQNVRRVFTLRPSVDDEVFEELEQILIEADLGVDTTLGIINDMRRIACEKRLTSSEELFAVLKEELVQTLESGAGAVSEKPALL